MNLLMDINWDTIHLNKSKNIQALGATILQTATICKGLVEEFHSLQIQSEMNTTYLTEKEKYMNKKCENCHDLQEVISSKNTILQSVASLVTRLNETRDFKILNDIFKILSIEPHIKSLVNENVKDFRGKELQVDNNVSMDILTQNKAVVNNDIGTNVKLYPEDESISEIEGTPTGRMSPIIGSKKLRNCQDNPDVRERKKCLSDRKKCLSDRSSPESKVVKLSQSTPSRFPKANAKLKQTRLNLSSIKSVNMVDLTCSPVFENDFNGSKFNAESNLVMEAIDDCVILPSPTSNPIKPDFSSIYKTFPNTTKSSPNKFKTSSSVIGFPIGEIKKENLENADNFHTPLEQNDTEIDSSFNVLQPHNVHSHSKSPLGENINLNNIPTQCDESISLLQNNVHMVIGKKLKEERIIHSDETSVKREVNPILEPLYKEPTVRKKAEKRALPGWSCDQCKNFYNELYKDSPAMLARLMRECSRHRARRDPARRSPPGYWEPRWRVAADTEAFNRENDAL